MGANCTIIHNHYYCNGDNSSNGNGISSNFFQILSSSGQLSGSGSQVEGFSAPGGSQTMPPDFPSTGMGETAAQVVMPAGTIKNLRVVVVPHGVSNSGTVDFVVRINGADTPVSCQVSGSGQADSGVATVTVSDGDLVSVKVHNLLQGNVSVNFTYSIAFAI